jgi:hypothetical protein
MASHRTVPRRRRRVPTALLWVLTPLFRRSWARDAWVLRGVGERWGPVLVSRRGR